MSERLWAFAFRSSNYLPDTEAGPFTLKSISPFSVCQDELFQHVPGHGDQACSPGYRSVGWCLLGKEEGQDLLEYASVYKGAKDTVGSIV